MKGTAEISDVSHKGLENDFSLLYEPLDESKTVMARFNAQIVFVRI